MKLMEMEKFPLKELLGRREYVLVVGLCIIIGGILGFLLLLCRVEVEDGDFLGILEWIWIRFIM